MPATFKVNLAETYSAVMFMSCEPRKVFQSEQQEIGKQSGLPRWSVTVVVTYPSPFGDTTSELLTVLVEAPTNPAESIPPGTPVELVDLAVSVMDKRNMKTGEILGAQVNYRAEAVRPVGSGNGRKTAASQSSGGEG